MPGEPVPRSTTHGLVFLMFLSFIVGFLVARLFATLYPDVVVVAGGIHFHHFWYGLVLIVAAGGLGIVHGDPRFRRWYAVAFGFGSGLVGDEIGLLLTFGNYDSIYTFEFFVLAVSSGVLGILFFRFKKELEHDVFSLERGDRLVSLGIVVGGLAALPFAADQLAFGVAVLVAGIAVVLAGAWSHRRKAA